MQWYYSLTPKQRQILLNLALAVVAVLTLLGLTTWQLVDGGWIYSGLYATPPLSLPASPTPEAGATPEVPSTPTSAVFSVDTARAGAISNAVAEARGVLPRWSTPLMLVDDYNLTLSLYYYYQAHPPLALQARPSLDMLGLWMWEDDVQIDPRAQARVAGALYVPEEEQLYLRRDWTGTPDALELQLAYGYARAIPDQHGDLLALRERASSFDHRLALDATAAGDALLALWRYAGTTPGEPRARELTDEVAPATRSHWKPDDPLLRDVSLLPLTLGEHFAATLYELEGLAALDAALRRPPRSTEQLLHPDRYLASDEPTLLSLVEPQLERGWALTHTETLGEAMMGLTLLEWSKGEFAGESVVGWDGDILQAWRGPNGERVVLWQTVWDSGQDAARFYGALISFLPRPLLNGMIRDKTPASTLPAGGRWWASRQGALFLYRRADRVWLVWGDDVAAVEAVGRALEVP